MQIKLLLTLIREVAECASIPHLCECYAGSTQWSPPPHRPTGNYWEPGRERARGSQGPRKVCGPPLSVLFFLYCSVSFMGKHRVGLHVGSSASAFSYHTPPSQTRADTHPLAAWQVITVAEWLRCVWDREVRPAVCSRWAAEHHPSDYIHNHLH